MKTRLLFVVLVLECIIYFNVKPKINNDLKHTINRNSSVDINKIKLENYVIGVVAAEMPATFSFEALKAQAVVSRTFAYKKIFDNKIDYDSLYKDKGQAYITIEEMREKWKEDFNKYYDIVIKSVKETSGEIIVYNDKPINSYYFSSSNGFTEDSTAVFEEEDYLVSVEVPSDINSKEYFAEKNIPLEDFKQKLKINADKLRITNISRSDTNHVSSIIINEKKYTGIEIRKLLDLRSTDFEIEIIEDDVKITTRGYGHGVGMSQNGANSLALEGKKYEDIINYFYKNVSIKKL